MPLISAERGTGLELPRENVFGHTKKVRLLCRRIAQLKGTTSGTSVLDLGCGNGAAVSRFLACVADDVLGVDMHEPSIEFANHHFGRPGLEFRCADATCIADERQFDVVVMADVLEHVSLPDELVRVAASCVRPGGTVFITVPNGRGPFELEQALFQTRLGKLAYTIADLGVAVLNKTVLKDAWTRVVKRPGAIPYNHESGHVNFFRERDILQLASGAGLKLVERTNLSWLSGPYTNTLFAPSALFCHLNALIADHLPAFLVSAWMFEFRAGGSSHS